MKLSASLYALDAQPVQGEGSIDIDEGGDQHPSDRIEASRGEVGAKHRVLTSEAVRTFDGSRELVAKGVRMERGQPPPSYGFAAPRGEGRWRIFRHLCLKNRRFSGVAE